MIILADENIPLANSLFDPLGEVRCMPGRRIAPEHVRDVDVLLVRSVTRVDEALLKNSRVQYVGTATIGTDHLDTAYLDRRGIRWCAAPGCNAGAVADYVLSSLLTIVRERKVFLRELTLGVVGCGNVGSLVASRARALGMEVIENDPPLERQTKATRYRPLRDVFNADVITLHTPLTKEGPDATHHMVGHRFLNRMRDYACLINTSRGAVVDNTILKTFLGGEYTNAILDVWEHEPAIDPDLVKKVYLATPHIAGYSLDGKIRGTWMVYRQVCEWLGREVASSLKALLDAAPASELQIDARGLGDDLVVGKAMTHVYTPLTDDAFFRGHWTAHENEDLAVHFDACRRKYRTRREFSSTTVHLKNGTNQQIEMLRGIGFKVIAI